MNPFGNPFRGASCDASALSSASVPVGVPRLCKEGLTGAKRAGGGWGWRAATLWLVLAQAPFAMAQPLENVGIRDSRGSLVDVAARTAYLQKAPRDAYLASSLPEENDCAAVKPVVPPQGPMVIPPRYASGNHGPLHPDYEATVQLYRDFESNAATFANQYVAFGQPRYTQCLLSHLDRWVQAEALLDYTVSTEKGASNQAWYQAEWSASAAALALSQVVKEPSLDGEVLKRVIAWLHRVSLKQISYPGGDNTCCNNHAYWRGVHATMVGVLANDAELFRWGLGRYRLAIDQIASDGSWPLEIARHEQALHYQNYALLPLVTIAEIAAQQGIDLYGYEAHGRSIHNAVDYLVSALAQARATTSPGDKPPLDLRAFAPGRGDQAWAEFYRARFGRDPLGLLSKPVNSPRNGGRATLLVYQPDKANANATASRP